MKHLTHLMQTTCMVATLWGVSVSSATLPTYAHTTEILTLQAAWELHNSVYQQADTTYGMLNALPCFNKKLLLDPHAMRHEWRINQAYAASEHVIQFHDPNINRKIELSCTFFDRDADTLLLVAPGFTNTHHVMAPFTGIFPAYDVVLMDFRGHKLPEKGTWSNPCSWNIDPLKTYLNINCSLISFGAFEEQDIKEVTEYFRGKKKYKRILGLGICYGAFVLLKATAVYPHLFEKIVLDGCWTSLDAFADKIRNDPGLILNPQHSIKVPTCGMSPSTMAGIIEKGLYYWGMDLPKDLSIIPYATIVEHTDVLLFHGKDDRTITRKEFKELWQALATPHKTAVITDNPHVRNHWRQKEVYAHLCNQFFNQPYQQFLDQINPCSGHAQHHAQPSDVQYVQTEVLPSLKPTRNV